MAYICCLFSARAWTYFKPGSVFAKVNSYDLGINKRQKLRPLTLALMNEDSQLLNHFSRKQFIYLFILNLFPDGFSGPLVLSLIWAEWVCMSMRKRTSLALVEGADASGCSEEKWFRKIPPGELEEALGDVAEQTGQEETPRAVWPESSQHEHIMQNLSGGYPPPSWQQLGLTPCSSHGKAVPGPPCSGLASNFQPKFIGGRFITICSSAKHSPKTENKN